MPALVAATSARAAPSPPAALRARCRRPSAQALSRSRGACAALRSFTEYGSGDAEGGRALRVEAYPNSDAVAAALVRRVEGAAQAAVAARGHFALAVPGGSVLKMLAGLSSARMDWSKTSLWFVNHKCVDNDSDLATLKKARALFLSAVPIPGANVHALGGSADAAAEAAAYEAALREAMRAGTLPTAGDLPAFDLMLLGMGSDGHVGSLYPAKKEVTDASGRLVLPVSKGEGPSSITLSLPVMNAAAEAVMAMSGEKKAAAVTRALESGDAAEAFPAAAVRPRSMTWLLDAGAASSLRAAPGVAALR